MLKAFVEKIENLAFQSMERDGRTLTTRQLYAVKEAEPEALKVHTLGGILDFSSLCGHMSGFVAHVEDYLNVHLKSSHLQGSEKQRDCYVTASAYPIRHQFGEYMPLESFVTYIQSCFVPDETTAAILKVVGNVVQGAEAEYADDGVTQRVTARAGVTRREIVDLPNPVTLRPYRTFPDIEQPESLFVLRMKAGKEGEQPLCALFEADGGAWKNKAVETIKQYFRDADMVVVG